MTSLKVKYADETMDAMAKILDSAEFKEIYRTASFHKEAGPAYVAFTKDVDAAAAAGTDLELIYSKHSPALAQEDNTEPGTVQNARQYMAEKGKGKQPGLTVPEPMEAKDAECAECLDSQSLAAVEFTLKHLVKIADALDGKGFASLAGVIDEAIEKVASKKKIVKAADRKPGGYEGGLGTYGPASKDDKDYNIGKLMQLAKLLKEKFGVATATPDTLPAALEEARLWLTVKQPEYTALKGMQKELADAHETSNWNQMGLLAQSIYDLLTKNFGEEKQPSPVKPRPGLGADAAFIKEVQRFLGVKDDGIWGPKTCGAWNKHVKTLEPPYSMQGCQEGGPMPEVGAIKATMQHGKKKSETAAAPETKPAAPKAKPAQISDTEELGETPRQKELRQQYEKMTGGKSISGR